MSFRSARLKLIFFLSLALFILISGCVVENYQQDGNQQNITHIPASFPPAPGIKTLLSTEQASDIIKKFVLPHTVDNLTDIQTFDESNLLRYEFQTDDAMFLVNPLTGRVQSAKWTESGPVIRGITEDINKSCTIVGEYAREKYPEIWISNTTRDLNLKSAKKWPLSSETEYECAWFETLYIPDKITSPHYAIGSRNSVDIVINPISGQIISYEETYVPLNPSLELKPSISEEQAKELAIQFFETSEIIKDFPSEQTSYGLSISTDDIGNQYVVWTLEVVQHRNATFGGLIGIDAHDGHVVYHASF
jgi:hypothetical protein